MFRLPALNPWAYVAVAVGACLALAWAGMALYQHGYDVRDTECQAATAATTGQRLSVALDGSQALRAAEGQSFKQLAGAADAYDKTFTADLAAAGAAAAADAGLRGDIEAAVATAGAAGLPEGAALERARSTARALGAALGECSQRRLTVAEQLAESQRRHQACVAEHGAAEALNVRPEGLHEP